MSGSRACLILLGYFAIISTANIESKCPDQESDNDLNIGISHNISLSSIGRPWSMQIQHSTGDIFIGGDDTVAAIAKDLTRTRYVSYHKGVDNHIKFLMMDKRNNLLIACGTSDFGLCARHSSENITSYVRFHGNNQADHIMSSSGTTAGTISYPDDGASVVFHVARTLDSNFDYEKQQSVSTKIWNKNKTGFEFLENSTSTISKEPVQSSMTISKQYASSFNVSYVFAFSDNGYTYFITKQPKKIDSTKNEIRIIRICESDASLQNYIEMQLICRFKETKFTEPVSGYFDKVSDEFVIRKSLFSNKILFLLAYDSDEKSDYGICIYDMLKVNNALDINMKNCLGDVTNGAIKMGLNYYFNGTDRYCKDQSSNAHTSDMCSKAKPFYVKKNVFGKNLLKESGEPLRFPTMPTAMAVTTYGEVEKYTVVVLGFQNGDIKLLYLEPDRIDGISVVGVNLSPGKEILSIQVHELSIYVMTKSTLHKIEINSFCRVLPNCYRCITNKFLRCEFCENHGCFEHKNCPCKDCTDGSCSPTIYDVFPISGPRQGGTKITMCGQGLGHVTPGLMSIRKVYFGDSFNCSVVEAENFNSLTCLTRNLNDTSLPLRFPMSVHIFSPSSPNQTRHDRFGINKTIDIGFFTYLEPAVFYFFPHKGPKRGGTTLTMIGRNLHVGSSAKAVIGDINCWAYFRNETVLKCNVSRFDRERSRMKRSDNENGKRATRSVQLHIDNAQLDAPGSFDFKNDPNLTMPKNALRSIERYSLICYYVCAYLLCLFIKCSF